jgi:hypothetical protein
LKTFEYKVIPVTVGLSVKKTQENAEETFNKLGAEGWRLVVPTNVGFIFVREKS